MTIGLFKPPHRAPPAYAGMAEAGAGAAGLYFRSEALFDQDALACFAQTALQGIEQTLAHIDIWRGQGHCLEDIYIDAIAPCARLLGQWWLDDVLDFAQVTIGAANLHRVLYRLSPEFCAPGADHPVGLNLLLATEPQSQHTMGTCMVGEFFRRHGWGVQLATPQDGEEVLDLLRRNWFDAVGLSISSDRHLDMLAALIARLRLESPNQGLSVWVGGPLAQTEPQALRALGADFIGGDARETLHLMQHFIGEQKA